jgi:hypothetical protein
MQLKCETETNLPRDDFGLGAARHYGFTLRREDELPGFSNADSPFPSRVRRCESVSTFKLSDLAYLFTAELT